MKRLLVMLVLLPLPAWAGPFDGTWKSQLDKVQSESKPMEQALENGRFKCVGCSPNVTIDVKADGSDQKVAGTNDFDSIAVAPVDAHRVKIVCKKDKQVAMESVGAPVTGMLTYTRAAAPPVGAHAISGTWNVAKVASSSDALLTVTYRATRDGMSMTAGTGESYTAALNIISTDAQQNKLTLTFARVGK